MSSSSGLRFDLKLQSDLPPEVILWLSKHVIREGDMEEVNDFFKRSGKGDFEDWKGGTLRRDEDDTHWHLKSNGSATSYERVKIAFFLNELQPWVIMEPGRCIALLINEEKETRELIFWYNEAGDVVSRRGKCYRYEDHHPSEWCEESLNKPLEMEADVSLPNWETPVVYDFGKRATVSVKAEKKRILARQHNANYNKTLPAAEADELAAMEKGI